VPHRGDSSVFSGQKVTHECAMWRIARGSSTHTRANCRRISGFPVSHPERISANAKVQTMRHLSPVI
jgi:hypothetical protein